MTKLIINDYKNDSFVVIGNSKIYKDQMKKMGGKWHLNLKSNGRNFQGWIFKNKMKNKVSRFIIENTSKPIDENFIDFSIICVGYIIICMYWLF